ncbi:sulfotransferase 1C4-like [Babylonia areolata]|uniref:sulfotransferase 1C4-like n=1 Tax=Babylonia areolata TaxID=304850 RepID=UPI003FD3097E
MSDLLHLKDQFGNDRYFGDTGPVRVAAVPNVDFRTLLDTISHLPLRQDDVIVVGYPKSGNNWIHHMVTMLKAGTTDLPLLYGEDSFQFLDALGNKQWLTPPHNPRVLLSHLPFRFLPRDVTEKKVKVVYLTRNPKDVFVSLYCHLKNVHLPLGYEGSWSQFFTVMLEEGFWYGDVLEHLKDWQSEMDAHPHHPFFHCSYEDTSRDTLTQVERLNEFLGTGRDRQLCQDIVRNCRLDNMTVTRRQKEETAREVFLWKDPLSSFYRKGVVGDWKNWFTVAQNEQFDDVYKTKMADYKYTFQYE